MLTFAFVFVYIVSLVLDGIKILFGTFKRLGICIVNKEFREEEEVRSIAADTVKVSNCHTYRSRVTKIIAVCIDKNVISVILVQFHLCGSADRILLGAMVVFDRNNSAPIPAGIICAFIGCVTKTAADDEFHAGISVDIADSCICRLEYLLRLILIALEILYIKSDFLILYKRTPCSGIFICIKTIDVGVRIFKMSIIIIFLRHGNSDNEVIGEVLLKVACCKSYDSSTMDKLVFIGCGTMIVVRRLTWVDRILEKFIFFDKFIIAKACTISACIVDAYFVCTVVYSNFIDTIAVKVACCDIVKGIEILLENHARLVKSRGSAKCNCACNTWCIFAI